MPIGTTAALIGSAVLGAAGQASAANKAAKAQTNAANNDIAFQKETRDIIRGDLSQYRSGGLTAQQAYDYEMGLGNAPMIGGTMPAIEEFTSGGGNALAGFTDPSQVGGFQNPMQNGGGGDGRAVYQGPNSGPPGQGGGSGTQFRVNGQVFKTRQEAEAYAAAHMTGGTAYGGYTKTPGYDFRMKQGMDALQSSAAARGGLYSGAAMRDALQYGQDYASNEYGNYLARLGGRADAGMSAAQMSGQASQQAASGVSNALGNIGNAKAAGAIGVGNAFTGGLQNMASIYGYQNNLTSGAVGRPSTSAAIAQMRGP